MMNVRDIRKVAWRRHSAPQNYSGYLAVTEPSLRLVGREQATGIDATLTIPHSAVCGVRMAERIDEYVAGAPGLVLDVSDGVAIFLRPLGGDLELAPLARRILSALDGRGADIAPVTL
jgi:hypothetical protein